jgi:hypothetical protein
MMNRLVKSINGMAIMILIVCAGCAQVAYDSLQNSQAYECRTLQGAADRDECMRRSNMSYEEYQRQLDKQKRE